MGSPRNLGWPPVCLVRTHRQELNERVTHHSGDSTDRTLPLGSVYDLVRVRRQKTFSLASRHGRQPRTSLYAARRCFRRGNPHRAFEIAFDFRKTRGGFFRNNSPLSSFPSALSLFLCMFLYNYLIYWWSMLDSLEFSSADSLASHDSRAVSVSSSYGRTRVLAVFPAPPAAPGAACSPRSFFGGNAL